MKNFIFAISCIFFANYSSAQASSKPNTPQTNTQKLPIIQILIRYGYQSINLGNVSNTVYAPNGLESLGTNTKLDMSYTQGIRIGFKF
jgi:hypothetical protein